MENYITKENGFYNDMENQDELNKYKADVDEAIRTIINKGIDCFLLM